MTASDWITILGALALAGVGYLVRSPYLATAGIVFIGILAIVACDEWRREQRVNRALLERLAGNSKGGPAC